MLLIARDAPRADLSVDLLERIAALERSEGR